MRSSAIIACSMAVAAPAHGAETTLVFDGEASMLFVRLGQQRQTRASRAQ